MKALLRKIYTPKAYININESFYVIRTPRTAVRLRPRSARTHLITRPRPPVCDFRGSPRIRRTRERDLFFFPGNAVSTPFSSSYRVRVITRCTSRYASELSPIVRRENMKFRAAPQQFFYLSTFPFLPSYCPPCPRYSFSRPRPRSRNCEQNALNGPERVARLKTRVGRECD